jgi:hypothetical protein
MPKTPAPKTKKQLEEEASKFIYIHTKKLKLDFHIFYQ